MPNAPRGREKNITGQQATVHKRGEGLGTGPVGNAGGYSGRGGRGNGGGKRSGGGSPLTMIIVLILALLGGGGGAFGMLSGGSSAPASSYVQPAATQAPQQPAVSQAQLSALFTGQHKPASFHAFKNFCSAIPLWDIAFFSALSASAKVFPKEGT